MKTITVVQFNALCECYEPTDHLDGAAKFPVRAPLIKRSLLQHSPDVMTVQEVNPASWFKVTFGAEYEVLFAAKADRAVTLSDMRGPVSDAGDGAVLMFKRSTIKVLDAWRLSTWATEEPVGIPERQFAQLAHAQHVATGRTFWVCGMHMKANRMESYEDDRRCRHIRQVFRQLHLIRSRDVCRGPLIFAGDFNASPLSPTIRCLLGMGGDPRPPPLVSVFVAAGGSDPITFVDSSYNHKRYEATLDYVMVECDAPSGRTWHVIRPLFPPVIEGNDAVVISGSDHLPIGSVLAFADGPESTEASSS